MKLRFRNHIQGVYVLQLIINVQIVEQFVYDCSIFQMHLSSLPTIAGTIDAYNPSIFVYISLRTIFIISPNVETLFFNRITQYIVPCQNIPLLSVF